jgi:hypothetical protein
MVMVELALVTVQAVVVLQHLSTVVVGQTARAAAVLLVLLLLGINT